MLLIVVDSYSKWPEVVIQNSTTSEATVPHNLSLRSSRTSWTGWECCTNLHCHLIQVLMGKQSDLCKL